MTGLQTATLAGMVVALGLVLAARALRPAPPSLIAALEQLSASPTAAGSSSRWLVGPSKASLPFSRTRTRSHILRTEPGAWLT